MAVYVGESDAGMATVWAMRVNDPRGRYIVQAIPRYGEGYYTQSVKFVDRLADVMATRKRLHGFEAESVASHLQWLWEERAS